MIRMELRGDQYCKLGSAQLSKEDIDALRPNSWLTDENVTFVQEWCKKDMAVAKHRDHVYMVDPAAMVCAQMADGDEEDLKDAFDELLSTCSKSSSGEKVDPTPVKMILFPVNNKRDFTSVGGTHWSLLVAVRAAVPEAAETPHRHEMAIAAGTGSGTYSSLAPSAEKAPASSRKGALPTRDAAAVDGDGWVLIHFDSHLPGNRSAAEAAASAVWPVLAHLEFLSVKTGAAAGAGAGGPAAPAPAPAPAPGPAPAPAPASAPTRRPCPSVLEAAGYPQQDNSVDCGVFACWSMRVLASTMANEGRMASAAELRGAVSQAGAKEERARYIAWAREVRAANLGEGAEGVISERGGGGEAVTAAMGGAGAGGTTS